MAAKGTSQRMVEVVAVLAVLGFGVVIAWSMWNRVQPDKPPENIPPPAVYVPTAPLSDPNPRRAKVASAAELPAQYPAIDRLLAGSSSLPLGTELPRVSASLIDQAQVRHWRAYSLGGGLAKLDPTGTLAIVAETTPANTERLAVWNAATGKLIRFLSQEIDKPTAPYEGKENADFGASVDGKRGGSLLVFSPRGDYVASMQREAYDGVTTVSVWEIATGKLLPQYHDLDHIYTLQFPDEDYLVLESRANHPRGIVPSTNLRVRVATGEPELLLPLRTEFHLGRNSVSSGGQIMHVSQHGLEIVNVATRERMPKPQVMEDIKLQYTLCWLSPDHQSLIGCTAAQFVMETWDVATGERTGTRPLEPKPAQGQHPVACPEAGLIAFQQQNREMEFFRADTGKLRTILLTPFFQRGQLVSITSDARRMLFRTDQETLVAVDWPEGLPEGVIDLGPRLSSMNLPAER